MIIGISGKIQSGKDTVGRIWQYLHYCESRKIAFSTWELLSEQEKNFKWKIKKFAGKVKEVCSLLTGIPVNDFEKESVKQLTLGNEWEVKRFPNFFEGPKGKDAHYEFFKSPLSVREMLQKVGTECMRDHLHPDVWVNALFVDYKNKWTENSKMVKRFGYQPVEYPNWIITDVRFPNEAQAIKDRGGILIRVNRSPQSYEEAIQPTKEHFSEIALDYYQNWDYVIENDGSIDGLIEKVRRIDDLVIFSKV